ASELQARVDRSLRGRARGPRGNIGMGPTGGRSPLPQRRVPSRTGHGDPDEGLGIDRLPPQAFGGASGAFTVFKHGGGTWVPPGQGYQIPSTPQIKAPAAPGQGQFFPNMRVPGTHIRVLVTGIGPAGRPPARLRAAP